MIKEVHHQIDSIPMVTICKDSQLTATILSPGMQINRLKLCTRQQQHRLCNVCGKQLLTGSEL